MGGKLFVVCSSCVCRLFVVRCAPKITTALRMPHGPTRRTVTSEGQPHGTARTPAPRVGRRARGVMLRRPSSTERDALYRPRPARAPSEPRLCFAHRSRAFGRIGRPRSKSSHTLSSSCPSPPPLLRRQASCPSGALGCGIARMSAAGVDTGARSALRSLQSAVRRPGQLRRMLPLTRCAPRSPWAHRSLRP